MEKEARGKGNGYRYLMATLGSSGLGLIYGLKVNLHVAIVSMVNHTAVSGGSSHNKSGSSSCDDVYPVSNDEKAEDGPFVWSTVVQGVLLSAYFLGYMVAELPGGRIAEVFSAKWVMLGAVVVNIVGALLTPAAALWHYGALILIRVLQGFGGGMTFPAMHVILAHWAPPTERSVMSSIVYSGTALGTVIFMLVSGIIGSSLGWQYVFYIEGACSCIWMIFWIIFAADSPNETSFISQDERSMIAASLGDEKHETKSVPWKAVWTSKAFWAILIAHTCSNWGWYMVLIELPSYMKMVFNFKLSDNAVLTTIPFLCMWIFSMILSKVLDTLLIKEKITTTWARKTATLIASLGPLLCFVALCFIGCRREWAVALMCVAVTCIGGMFCGFLSNHIDIAPNYAGTLMALTNTVATIPGILVPLFVGWLTHDDPGINSWQIIFGVTMVLYVIEILVYTTMGSGVEQSWNK
ncbi:unnamed protein product [Brassicogethes aeneus]|uniref:Major facilitator superfamily (MFS) profile domain-containing protein n=1 Tax=Brassicogethes aeneus TaxID=1431903 RepID=A0A9P0FMG8_BRAAE|nr:unnamed protein product [Brassicogethes aeneus]